MQIQTLLRGAYFRGGDIAALVEALPDGTPVQLEPEPENEHDPNAIRVVYHGPDGPTHIGYVAAEDTPGIHVFAREWPIEARLRKQPEAEANPLIRPIELELPDD